MREPSSTSSSEVQAEVQRQLREYVQRYEGVTNSLRTQLEEVQRERERLLASQRGESHGDQALQRGESHGDRAWQHGESHGDRALQRGESHGDRAPQHGESHGDRASQRGESHGDRASQRGESHGDRASQHGESRGDRAFNGVPPGDRAFNGVPPGDRAFSGVPPGDRASSDVPGDRAFSGVPPGDRAFSGGSQGGRVTMDHLGLPSGSRVAGHGEPESGPTRRQEQQARDDREGDGQWEPTQIDLLSVIATGARQLQDAQTKAFQKKSSQEEPEPVKPGVTSLPTLKGPDPETSPVEVQDWLQLLQAPMSDLSDNSAEWWGRVQELAQRAYQGWSSATPMEWLALRAPREKELEEGRFARLNARAASMILSSLDETFGLGSPSSSSEAD
eukprot:s3369_g5.t2